MGENTWLFNGLKEERTEWEEAGAVWSRMFITAIASPLKNPAHLSELSPSILHEALHSSFAHADLSFSMCSNLLILGMNKLRPKEIVSPVKHTDPLSSRRGLIALCVFHCSPPPLPNPSRWTVPSEVWAKSSFSYIFPLLSSPSACVWPWISGRPSINTHGRDFSANWPLWSGEKEQESLKDGRWLLPSTGICVELQTKVCLAGRPINTGLVWQACMPCPLPVYTPLLLKPGQRVSGNTPGIVHKWLLSPSFLQR